MVLAFDTTTIIVAVLGSSALTALIGVIGRRLMASGRVRTTDADQLWRQDERIRLALERDNDRLRSEFTATTEDVFELRTQALDLMAKATKATQTALGWKRQLGESRARIERLEAENAALRHWGGS